MFNSYHHFKIAVRTSADGVTYIVVARNQLGDVRRLLIESGIGHRIGGRPEGEEGDQRIILIGKLWDRERVQRVLESVERDVADPMGDVPPSFYLPAS